MPPNWSRGWLKRPAAVCEPLLDDPLAPTALVMLPEPNIHGKTSIGRFRCGERTFRMCHGGDAPIPDLHGTAIGPRESTQSRHINERTAERDEGEAQTRG